MARRLKEKHTVKELVQMAQYHDCACALRREPFNWDNPLNRKDYSYNRELAFEYRRLAREKKMDQKR